MSILAMFVALFSVVMFIVSALVSIVASGAPSYFAGLLYDRTPVIKHNPMIGALTLCGESHTVDRQVSNTLTDTPAIIQPSYQLEPVTIMTPRMIGDHRDARGRFMPKYKA